jgi:hypothetical protein
MISVYSPGCSSIIKESLKIPKAVIRGQTLIYEALHTFDSATRTPLKMGMNLRAPEWYIR